MKFSGQSLIILFFSVFILNSCKNDLKLNAPYKEIPSIYAVLNPQEKMQVIRINKVFLGEGDANVMAKVADSINYQPDELSVTLTRFLFGKQVMASQTNLTMVFKDSMVQTMPGAFNTNQRVYVSSEKLSTSGDYVLTVRNNRTGNIFTSSATAIDSVNGNQGYFPLTTKFTYPYPPGTFGQFPLEYVDYANPLNGKFPFDVKFQPDGNRTGKIYQVTVRMHFYDSLYDNSKIYRYVDYAGTNQQLKDVRKIGNTNYLVTEFRGTDIFNAAGIGLSRLGLNNNIWGRKMYMIEYLVYASTQEYIDYLQYAAPSLNISQNKPLYSNFDNNAALGIFTFRTRCSVKKEMAHTFINAFSSNPNTCTYFFYDAAFQHKGC